MSLDVLNLAWRSVPSPVGPLLLLAQDDALCAIDFETSRRPVPRQPQWQHVPEAGHAVLDAAEAQLSEYFAGQRRVFDLPLRLNGTAFQQRVWQQLQRIEFGRTISYAELAQAVDLPGGARAVGGANGRNPVPIVVPCHRVVAADGSLGGFSGGLPVKQQLLALEQPDLLAH